MDAALKARNLGSAAVRKQRMQQRQVEQHLAFTKRVEQKKQTVADICIEIESDNESDQNASPNIDPDSAADTPSENSVPTPEDLSSPHAFIRSNSTKSNPMSDPTLVKSNNNNIHSGEILPTPELVPRMQATLTTIADWNYDRFSMFLALSDEEKGIEDTTAEEEDEETSSSSDEDEDPLGDLRDSSPIEIATPVTYISPRIKPSVVFITAAYPPIKPVSTIVKRPTVRRHVSEQLMLGLDRNGLSIGDSKSFQYANSSQETVGSTNDSSQVSRSVSLASQKGSMLSRSTSDTSHSDQSHKSPKRKSSMPLLFGNNNNKSGHSRMSSIKKFIRSSTLGPPPSGHSHSNSFQRTPSGSTLETHFEDRGASMEVIREPPAYEIKRPMTARAPAPAHSETHSLPAPPNHAPPPVPVDTASRENNNEIDVSKTRPVSKFRSRTGSFGHALKTSNGGPKKADASAPPLPTISIPPPTQSSDIDNFPSPPPLTPRNPRRSVSNYSPFPSGEPRNPSFKSNQKASAILGLGLSY